MSRLALFAVVALATAAGINGQCACAPGCHCEEMGRECVCPPGPPGPTDPPVLPTDNVTKHTCRDAACKDCTAAHQPTRECLATGPRSSAMFSIDVQWPNLQENVWTTNSECVGKASFWLSHSIEFGYCNSTLREYYTLQQKQ